jgi:hypothetical protein
MLALTTLYMYINKSYDSAVRQSNNAKPVSTMLPPSSPQLGGDEVRGPTSAAVSTGVADSAAVEAVTALPVPGVQKPPRWVVKRFQDRFAAVPLKA